MQGLNPIKSSLPSTEEIEVIHVADHSRVVGHRFHEAYYVEKDNSCTCIYVCCDDDIV